MAKISLTGRTEVLYARISATLKARLEAQAADGRMSVSLLVEQLLDDALTRAERKEKGR